jgi:ribosomal protein RSM22 (predicted rRNA methylase)
LVAAIVDRSRAYTSERERIGALRGDADLAARAVFFSVADAAKVMVPLAELDGLGLLPASKPLRVLDVGAGVGAMSLGLAAYLRPCGPRALDIVAVDRDRAALAVFEGAFEAVEGSRLGVIATEVDEPRWGGGKFDLVLAGSLFNEVLVEHQLELARELLEALTPGGALIIVEPALRDTARDLHRLRDALVEAGDAHVFAPCIRHASPCPMLADERDWCHEDRPTQLPPRAGKLAAATGLRDRGLKFSYLVLRGQAASLVDAPAANRRALRVVSQPARQKGKLELFGCGDGGRSRVRLVRRHRSPANRSFERVARGDVLILGEGDDLSADDSVDRVRPAQPPEG